MGFRCSLMLLWALFWSILIQNGIETQSLSKFRGRLLLPPPPPPHGSATVLVIKTVIVIDKEVYPQEFYHYCQRMSVMFSNIIHGRIQDLELKGGGGGAQTLIWFAERRASTLGRSKGKFDNLSVSTMIECLSLIPDDKFVYYSCFKRN